jgi:hypothetical protein
MTLVAHYPLVETSGSTAYDYTGETGDGTINGPTVGQAGPLGQGAYQLDGSDDFIEFPFPSGVGINSDYTVALWLNSNDFSKQETIWEISPGSSDRNGLSVTSAGELAYGVYDGSNFVVEEGSDPINSGEWYHVVAAYESSSQAGTAYLNGRPFPNTNNPSLGSGNHLIGTRVSVGDLHYDGLVADYRIYDHTLTRGEIQYLYDVSQRGVIYTDSKTHSSQVQPDLTNLAYTLNGGSATVTVVGSPGTASEERLTQALDGASDYSLSWSNSHDTFAIRIVAEPADITSRVTVDRVELLA